MVDEDPFGEFAPSSVSPHDFAQLVRRTPRDQLESVMADPRLRQSILSEVFGRMGEQYTGNRKPPAVIHWQIIDAPDGGVDEYETVLDGSECTVNTTPQHRPRVTIRLSGVQFLKLASGNSSPTSMFFTGKVKLSGDIAFAAGLSQLFNIPSATKG